MKATRLFVLTGEGLDDTNAADALLQRAEVVTDSLAHRQVSDVRITLETDRGEHDDGEHHHRQKREFPAEDEQQHQRHQHHQAGRHKLQQAPLDELAHRLDVGGHARDKHAGFLTVEERQTLALQMIEDPNTKVAKETLASAVDVDELQSGDEIRRDRGGDICRNGNVERVPVLLDEAFVDTELHDHWPGQRCGSPERGQHKRCPRGASIRQRQIP
ncbi:unannotated protein [freshwater metagenome]|uniref:Unannotated protein n=1 Tax=freshwater metagenome TaxID=449393 RepID=A0A6J6XKY6_9ZZZZ